MLSSHLAHPPARSNLATATRAPLESDSVKVVGGSSQGIFRQISWCGDVTASVHCGAGQAGQLFSTLHHAPFHVGPAAGSRGDRTAQLQLQQEAWPGEDGCAVEEESAQ